MREDTCKGYKLREITPADNADLAVLGIAVTEE